MMQKLFDLGIFNLLMILAMIIVSLLFYETLQRFPGLYVVYLLVIGWNLKIGVSSLVDKYGI